MEASSQKLLEISLPAMHGENEKPVAREEIVIHKGTINAGETVEARDSAISET